MLTEYLLHKETGSVRVRILRSARKTISMEVSGPGAVTVRAPGRLSDEQLTDFIEKHQDWIWRKLEESRERETTEVPWPKAEERTSEAKNREILRIRRRLAFFSEKMCLTCRKLTVRNQKTRWGSCSSSGTISFNYRLAYLPEELLDYVVVHELAHLRHMDHSREFWREVERYLPDYRERRERLKGYRIEG